MRLYLVRHGKAGNGAVDPERPLSGEGREGVGKMASFVKPLDLRVYAIWHSSKKRAVETAAILSGAITAEKGMIESDELNPNDDVKVLATELEAAKKDIMIVGHLPFLNRLASLLLTEDKGGVSIAFKECAILCLAHSEEVAWRVCWMVTPDMVKS